MTQVSNLRSTYYPEDAAVSVDNINHTEGDRRFTSRQVTVFRIVLVTSTHNYGLCRVSNISDGGMEISVGFEVFAEEIISVEFSDKIIIKARIAWQADGRAGVEFVEKIDFSELLKLLSLTMNSGLQRAPRIMTEMAGTIVFEGTTHSVKVLDISQKGLKVVHGGGLKVGMLVKIRLKSILESSGVVRWNRDGKAGIMLLRPIPHRDLARVSDL